MIMWLSEHHEFLIAWTVYSLMLVHFPSEALQCEDLRRNKRNIREWRTRVSSRDNKHDRKLDSTGSCNTVLQMCFAPCFMHQLRSKLLTRYLLTNSSVSDVHVHGVVIKNVRTTLTNMENVLQY